MAKQVAKLNEIKVLPLSTLADVIIMTWPPLLFALHKFEVGTYHTEGCLVNIVSVFSSTTTKVLSVS